MGTVKRSNGETVKRLPQEGEVGEDVLGVEEEGGAHPGGADEEGQGDGDEFYGEAEGLFLDLGQGLEEGDDQADDGGDGNRD